MVLKRNSITFFELAVFKYSRGWGGAHQFVSIKAFPKPLFRVGPMINLFAKCFLQIEGFHLLSNH